MGQTATISFSQFERAADSECAPRIAAARAQLGERCVLLAHHYQRADVYCHSDLQGDSLELARLAATTDAETVVFCGVHFMAEVADLLTGSDQRVILPDLAAGCTMADMASLAKINRCWRELADYLDPDSEVMPVTYINSAADLKSFVGSRGGIVCTSSNAERVLDWAWQRRNKVLFFPDQHLGRWSARKMGVAAEHIQVWDFNQPHGGLSEEQIVSAKILLWKGHCSVHQMFRPEHISAWRQKHPDGIVIAHPECAWEVCAMADDVGSTAHIQRTVRAANPGSRFLVGTELNLVQRLAIEQEPRQVHVSFMSPLVCMCSTMARIDPQHLAWCLENLADGKIVNQITVPEQLRQPATESITRMLDLCAASPGSKN